MERAGQSRGSSAAVAGGGGASAGRGAPGLGGGRYSGAAGGAQKGARTLPGSLRPPSSRACGGQSRQLGGCWRVALDPAYAGCWEGQPDG